MKLLLYTKQLYYIYILYYILIKYISISNTFYVYVYIYILLQQKYYNIISSKSIYTYNKKYFYVIMKTC